MKLEFTVSNIQSGITRKEEDFAGNGGKKKKKDRMRPRNDTGDRIRQGH